MSRKFLEVETKYSADDIDRMDFKVIANSLNPTKFLYVESYDVYYVKSENEFLRYRMPAAHLEDSRSELTFKKKHKESNNVTRTEVNLRIDKNNPELVAAFCEGLNYKKNFQIFKCCDIYYYPECDIVYYSVIDENNKVFHYLEIEVDETLEMSEDQAWAVIQKYEKLLSPLGISPQKRKRLSLFELFRKETK